MAIKLDKDVEQRLIGSIQRYCAEHLDEEVGDLKARLLLDFCLRESGPLSTIRPSSMRRLPCRTG